MPLVIQRKHAATGLSNWGATLTAQGTGWKKLQDRLARYQREFALDFWEHDVNNIAENHLEYARTLCPKDSGELAESLYLTRDHTTGTELRHVIFTKTEAAGFHSGNLSKVGGPLSIGSQATDGTIRAGDRISAKIIRGRYWLTTNNPIAWHVEYGTSKMAARPFMRPAYAFAREMFLARARTNWLKEIR